MTSDLNRGQKYKNNEVKLGILDFLANGKFTGADIRGRLAEVFGISEVRGIRKHLSDLYKKGFLDKIDRLGSTTEWWLKEDFDTFRKIVLFIKENEKNITWKTSDFTHDTKYGRSHLNEDLINWIISSGLIQKWYKTFGLPRPKGQDLTRDFESIIGMSKRKLLLAVNISPQILLFLLEPTKIKFLKDDKYNEFQNQIFTLLLKDALIDQSDKIKSILYNVSMKSVHSKRGKYQNGLKLSCNYEFFPELSSEIRG